MYLETVLSSRFNCHKLHFKYSLSVIDQASNKPTHQWSDANIFCI